MEFRSETLKFVYILGRLLPDKILRSHRTSQQSGGGLTLVSVNREVAEAELHCYLWGQVYTRSGATATIEAEVLEVGLQRK